MRQIPLSVTSRWTARPNQKLKDNEKLVTINEREFIEETKIPANAGRWMAKKCRNTDSHVRWSIITENLSDTLHEAVLKASQDIDN